MTTLHTPFCDLVGIEYPIVQAPMAGGPTTPELVAAVSAAGALGSFGHAYAAADAMRADAAAVRARTARPFNLNLFVAPVAAEAPLEQQRAAIAAVRPLFERHGLAVPERVPPPYAPDLATQLEAVCDLRPAVCTIHLGDLSPAVLARIRGLGIRLGSAATSVREARHLEGLGADFIIAQGGEAGGHRGTFLGPWEQAMTGTLALVRQIVRAVRVPVVAAGGIMDGAGVAAVLALGAQAAQLGTAFVVCPESGAPAPHKKAIAQMDGDETTITRAFSGKPARGVRNQFIEAAERERWPLLPFPAHGKLTAPLRQASARAGSPDLFSAWSGQAGSLARPLPAAELVRVLVDEAREVIGHLRRITGG
ncbi:MAG TPA: nitronate monooxygenase [Methylomirabilota bacterium]|nr:nitronate monooxygenase [Methylomirabilota bacterium]